MTNVKFSGLLVSFAALMLAGCAQQASQSVDGTASADASSMSAEAEEMKMQSRKIDELEAKLRAAERDLAAKDAKMSGGAAGSSASMSMGGGDLFPPNPRPGECYARVIIPAKYETTSKRVLKREAAERIEIIPAKYTMVDERVMITPPKKILKEVPAKYKTVTERVLDKPAHTVWKKGTGSGAGAGTGAGGGAAATVQRFKGQKVVETRVDDTGEIMCLVEVPASYKTVSKQVLVSPASTSVVEIPAEFRTIKKQELLEPAKERRIPIPEEYTTVTSTAKVSDESIEWRPVLCEVNMTGANVSALQGALKRAGCYECNVDGIWGQCTNRAVQCYAKRKGLPSGKNYVTIQVVEALGLKF